MTLQELSLIGEWQDRIRALQPRVVVELGTGQGASGAQIMRALNLDAWFYTINYADGHVFGEQLAPWNDDTRLTMLAADTLDIATLYKVPSAIDVLYIDTTHEAWHAAAELRLWQDKLRDGAIVFVDDLNHNDMELFWQSLPYEKYKTPSELQGVFRYDAECDYYAAFDKPYRTTYGGKYA